MKILFGPPQSQSLSHPLLIDLYRYWEAKRGERAFPARGDLDPGEITRCLPHVMLVDVFAAPLRFRYRLVGTGVTALAGVGELTGRWVDEDTFGACAEAVHSLYRNVVDTRLPVRAFGRAQKIRGDEWMMLENILMPLGEADGLVTMVLVGAINVICRAPIDPEAGRGTLYAAPDPIVQ